MLSVEGLTPCLDKTHFADNIFIYPTLASTNITAMEMAKNGCAHGTAVLANHQSAGKGRSGKSFFSPAESGLYMSMVLRTDTINVNHISMVTPAAAVAVCKSVEAVTGQKPGVKWVNDVLLHGKKICGILTEAVITGNNAGYVVVGIGVNIDTANFPEELRSVAGSVVCGRSSGDIRGRIAASIINLLMSPEMWMDEKKIRKEYRDRLVMLGKNVTVNDGGEPYKAVALDIDGACHLIIKRTDGETLALISGEVSVMPND
jgi:BirA family biotin operon repressor/biotin-[acetyl-CoA-carboxylase] ligase